MYESSDIVMMHLMAYTKIYKHTPSDFVFLRQEDYQNFVDMIKEIFHASTLPTPLIYANCLINLYEPESIRNIPPLLIDTCFAPPERFLCGIRENGIIKGIELVKDSISQERVLLIREP